MCTSVLLYTIIHGDKKKSREKSEQTQKKHSRKKGVPKEGKGESKNLFHPKMKEVCVVTHTGFEPMLTA